MQLDLFAPEPPPPPVRRTPEEEQRHSWAVCWPEWEGPRVGGYCEVDEICATKEEGGQIYCYTELCRLLEERPDGSWLAVIEMGEVHGKPWDKDGTRLILPITNIWPPVRILREFRELTIEQAYDVFERDWYRSTRDMVFSMEDA